MPGTKRSVTLRFLAAPMDANAQGRVAGGKILEWIDKAGYACAAGWTGRYCVTAYVGNIHFRRSTTVGAIVEVEARVVYTGRTSVQVVCTVTSSDPASGGKPLTNTQCLLIFVAMGDDGRPTEVPRFEPEDDFERRENARSRRLTEVRKKIEEEMAEQVYSDKTESCRETLRFLASPTDVNWGGKVHGGYVMHWIATTAKVVAERWHHGPVRATYAGGYRFYRPMYIGDMVEVEGRLIATHGSDMHVAVHVRSGDPRSTELLTTTDCAFVYQAQNEKEEPVDVRPWTPRLPEDVALQAYARRVVEIRGLLGRN
ncbi:acyl-CoA thioesterase [Nigerium massiliense]|uniref:acyl-CoA thioesterase n=1 Tax=Nigerium massiliense TaxID=1522317 RepID=UPI00058D46C2|nr:hotdog domain-containing protein [Nigerium massiliense]